MYLSEEQQKAAVAWKKSLTEKLIDPVVTEIVEVSSFILRRITIRIL